MEKQGKIVEMNTSTNSEGLVEINDESKIKIEIEDQLQALDEEAMSASTKEWMDRANRLYEQNLQMKRQLDYLQSNQDIQFINSMVAVYKLDDTHLKGLAKHHLNSMLTPATQDENR